MNKKELAIQIRQTVENAYSSTEAENDIIDFLDLLEPKDRERFAKWGNKKQQSTIEDCW